MRNCNKKQTDSCRGENKDYSEKETMEALWCAFYLYCNDTSPYACESAFNDCFLGSKREYSAVGIEKECYEWTRFMRLGAYKELEEDTCKELIKLTSNFLDREMNSSELKLVNRIIRADKTLWLLFANDFGSVSLPDRLHVDKLKYDTEDYRQYNRIMITIGKYLPVPNLILSTLLKIRKQTNVPVMLYTESLKDIEAICLLTDLVDGLKTIICDKKDVLYFSEFDRRYQEKHKSLYFYAFESAGEFTYSSRWRPQINLEQKIFTLDPLKNVFAI